MPPPLPPDIRYIYSVVLICHFFPQIHYILAEFNEVGRFTNQEIQVDSALFHLEQSAHCFYPKALITLAKIYLQLPHDNLSSLTIEVSILLSSKVLHDNLCLTIEVCILLSSKVPHDNQPFLTHLFILA